MNISDEIVEHDYHPVRDFAYSNDDELMEANMRPYMGVQIDWTKDSILNYWKNNQKIEA